MGYEQHGCEHGPWIPASLCGAVVARGATIVRVACPGGPHPAPVESGVIGAHAVGTKAETCPWWGIRVVFDTSALR